MFETPEAVVVGITELPTTTRKKIQYYHHQHKGIENIIKQTQKKTKNRKTLLTEALLPRLLFVLRPIFHPRTYTIMLVG
jgi:hypothetical protein